MKEKRLSAKGDTDITEAVQKHQAASAANSADARHVSGADI
jgi:hypothetical protein